ncbi:MAG: nucleoside triphosphate pyrophosphohydrolase [Magnetococcus sp. YQC-5]
MSGSRLATGEVMEALETLMARLRGAGGCPWDRKQTALSLLPYTIEEAYEVAEAVETHDKQAWRDELGDLLFHVVFHSRIAEEEGAFGLAEVISGVVDKMTRRHPHVFDPTCEPMQEARQVPARWEEIKRAEKNDPSSVFDDIHSRLPALLWAAKVQRKMAQVGFDWQDAAGVMEKVREELEELTQAMDTDAREEELGDVLFTLVNLARHYHVNPESALRRATRKFQERFRYMEQSLHAENRTPRDADLAELETLWQASKQRK